MDTTGFLSLLRHLAAGGFRRDHARSPCTRRLYLCWPSSTPRACGCCWKAEFLAISLVLVYVGAVMVLFLFVVMMLDINIDKPPGVSGATSAGWHHRAR